MNDRNLLRGLFLAAVALTFGLSAMQYSVGTLNRAGPGLFPLMVSGLLLVIAILTIVRSRFVPKVPMDFNPRNILLLLAAIGSFALVSRLLDMAAGIVAMVFIASFAASKRSLLGSAKIAAGLIAVAFGFQKLLGLNLPLF